MLMREVRRWLFWCAALWGAPALAHDPGISTAEVVWKRDRIEIVNGFAPDDAKQFLPPERRGEERWTEEMFPEVQPDLERLAPGLWAVTLGGRTLAPAQVRVRLLPGDNVSFEFVYPTGGDGAALGLRALQLERLPGLHRQFVLVADDSGSTIGKKLLKAEDAALEVRRVEVAAGAPTAAGAAAAAETAAQRAEEDGTTFWGFLKLGVEHIWLGIDHLLFLFALLIVCRSFRSIVAIVSCFTLAHSITLALATLEVVNLPGKVVEPLIAASIVFVGVENLVRRGAEPAGRWLLTLLFGLIHGFGFATVLRDLGVGKAGDGIVMPLLSFNLGVEVGQIVIAAVVMPVVWQLRKREKFVQRGVPALSVLVALAGLYWLIERTLL
jgi:hydrogenase/urease accessory protein HupE